MDKIIIVAIEVYEISIKKAKKRLRKYGAGQIVQEYPHKKTLILL
jgi:hypothetical protein